MASTENWQRDLLIAVVAWLVFSAVLIAHQLSLPPTLPLFPEGDDAMRMVMVEDLLHGAPWQNQGVPRDNTPYGGQMHWSALVGVPLAGLTALLGQRNASIIWPLLLLLPLMLLTVAATRRLVPAAGAGTIATLVVLNIAVTSEFSPGRIDHHNVQMVLVAAALLALVAGRRKAWGGALAGIILATALAVGIETLPIVAAVGLGYGVAWLADPSGHRAGVLGFAAGLAGGLTAHLLIAMPPTLWLAAYCDANSIVYVVAACLATGALAGAAGFASTFRFWARLCIVLGLGAVAVGVTVALFPQCLAGPYAGVDAGMLADIFPDIPEVKSFWQRVLESPELAIPFGGSVLLSLVLTGWLIHRHKGEARFDWLMLFCMLAAAAAVMLMQIRGARLAAMLALPAGAWVIAFARQYLRARPGVPAAALLIVGWLGFATWAQAIVLTLIATALFPSSGETTLTRISDCLEERAYADLTALPTARVAAPSVLGPYILLYTPHDILAAGYHRSGVAARDALDFFRSETRAREIAAERGLTLVAACTADAGLIEQLDQRESLDALPGQSSALRLYRIRS